MHWMGALDLMFITAISVSLGYGAFTGKDLPKATSDLVTALVAAKLTSFSANRREKDELIQQQKDNDNDSQNMDKR